MKASVTTTLIFIVLLSIILSQNEIEGTVSSMKESADNNNGPENSAETAASVNTNQTSPGNTESFTPTNTDCSPVSVLSYATYCVVGNICSGLQGNPETMNCPKRGAKAVADCHGSEESCTLPMDSHCVIFKSGVRGCSTTGDGGAQLGNEAANVPCSLPGWPSKQTPCPSLPQPCPTLPQPALESSSIGGTPCPSLPLKESDERGSEHKSFSETFV